MIQEVQEEWGVGGRRRAELKGLERKAEERGEQRSEKKDEDEKKEGRTRTRKGLLSNENQKLVFCEVCLHLFL